MNNDIVYINKLLDSARAGNNVDLAIAHKLMIKITGINNSIDAYDFLTDVKKWDI